MKPDRDARPDPESFLRLANRDPKRGHLKVYLGQAAGVGKTYKMLDDAHTMRRRGIDVVVALVETHGRAETASRIGDLEVVPRRSVAYKGATLEEMDLDAVLARKPDVAIVDELAHTNAPGSKNEKRWQDVLDLLAAGISVTTAVNVQHLEGVQDVVKSATGLEVKERVPDRVIRDADAVVNVDLPGPELRDRLKQGKIYPPAQAAQALENFFREENLKALRELALRETAENVDHGPTETAAVRHDFRHVPRGLPRARRRRAAARPARGARPDPPRLAHGGPDEHALVRPLREAEARPAREPLREGAPGAHGEHPARDLPRRDDRLPRVRGRRAGPARLRARGEGRGPHRRAARRARASWDGSRRASSPACSRAPAESTSSWSTSTARPPRERGRPPPF